MAILKNTTYSESTTVASSGANVVRPPIVASANTGLTNLNNLVYITDTNDAGRLGGDAIQVYAFGGSPGFIRYVFYGP